MRSVAERVASGGVMIALAAIFSYLESLFPLSLGVPGIKLGLANIVVLFALQRRGLGMAAAVSLLRVLLVSFMFGNLMSALYSISGALVSLAVMALLQKSGRFSLYGLSMAGGVAHPTAQLLVACLASGTAALISYLPILLISGLVAGFMMGALALTVLNRLAGTQSPAQPPMKD